MRKVILGCCFLLSGTLVFLTKMILEVMTMLLPNGEFVADSVMFYTSITLLIVGSILVLLSAKDSFNNK